MSHGAIERWGKVTTLASSVKGLIKFFSSASVCSTVCLLVGHPGGTFGCCYTGTPSVPVRPRQARHIICSGNKAHLATLLLFDLSLALTRVATLLDIWTWIACKRIQAASLWDLHRGAEQKSNYSCSDDGVSDCFCRSHLLLLCLQATEAHSESVRDQEWLDHFNHILQQKVWLPDLTVLDILCIKCCFCVSSNCRVAQVLLKYFKSNDANETKQRKHTPAWVCV